MKIKNKKAIIIMILFLSVFIMAWSSSAWSWGGGRHYGFSLHFGHGHHGHGYYGYRSYNHYPKHYYPYRSRYYGHRHPYSHRYGKSHYGSSSYRTYGNRNGHSDFNHGWNLLKNDYPDEAFETFGELAQAHPSKGIYKVGYAIAAAELGYLDKGIWAMRRALRLDPDSLHYVVIGRTMRPKVERLAKNYAKSAHYGENSKDAFFMLGTLNYLLGDLDRAQKALEKNRDARDYTMSAKNLERLVEKEIGDKKPGVSSDNQSSRTDQKDY